MNELKPCPFCGGEANLYRNYGRYGFFLFVECEICGARSKSYSTRKDPDSEDFWECDAAHKAEKAWNRRNVGELFLYDGEKSDSVAYDLMDTYDEAAKKWNVRGEYFPTPDWKSALARFMEGHINSSST